MQRGGGYALRPVGVTFSDRLAGIDYQRARRLLVLAGLAVLAVVALVAYARRVEDVEVVATLLFLPVFLAFVFRGVVGGAAAAAVAAGAYAALRYPAIEAVGAAEFSGLIASRSAAYLVFGIVGGWSMQVLEGSLTKLELYDEVDDETGLHNARHLLRQTDLEMARATRYQTLFSVVVLDLPTAPFAALPKRSRRSVLRDLARHLREGVRTVDHVVHVRDDGRHRFATILPETAAQGAEVFRARLGEQVGAYLAERGVTLDAEHVATRGMTFPGDETALDDLRAEFARIDAAQHR